MRVLRYYITNNKFDIFKLLALGAISGLGELLTIGIILPFVSIITKKSDIDLPIPLNLDSFRSVNCVSSYNHSYLFFVGST